MKALIIIGLIAILGGCGRHTDISKVEIPERYNQYRDLFSNEESWEEWCRSDMLELQELDEMWAEEHREEE